MKTISTLLLAVIAAVAALRAKISPGWRSPQRD
jgi:hypothetical protein